MTSFSPPNLNIVGLLATGVPSLESLSLRRHVRLCHAAGPCGFALRCGGEALHRFLLTRVVTTLLFAATLIGASAWLA